MDAIPSPPETRARSRSKTPFTKGEENGKDGRKSPNLQAINEDSETVATPIKSKRNSSQKASQSSSQSTSTVIQTTTTTSVTTRKSTGASVSNGSEAAGATITPPSKKSVSKEMKDMENKRTKEIKQNEINEKIVKKTITSTPKLSPNSSANFKLNSSHEDLDLDKHPAYKEYLEAGEYWNKYPKTDYTYSESSADRRDIGQGYVSMPNMSRKSLDRHVERVTTMIQNNPEQATYLRQRYQINPRTASKNKSFKLFSRSLLNYDSGDEVDLSQFDRRSVRRESIVRRTWVRVWTWITSIFTVFRRTTVTREQFRTNYGVPKESLWSRVKTVSGRSGIWVKESIVAFFKKIYLTLATILYLDTLLVRQRTVTETTTVEKGAGDATTTTAVEEEVVEVMPKNKRRFLWILVLLLPILLLAGLYWLCPLWTSMASSSSSYGAAVIAETYSRRVEAIRNIKLEIPPVGTYVKEVGSRAGEKIALMGTSALNFLGGLLVLPSFNWNWTWIGGSRNGGSTKETVVERMTVVHDWSQADSSKLGDDLRRELKIYVDGLMGEKHQDILQTTNNYFFQLNAQHELKIREIVEAILTERQKEFEKRSWSGEEIDNLMNLLLEKLRAGDYFKLDLTEENFRKIFLDMRQRFLNDNEIFLDKLLDDPRLKIFVQSTTQGSVDMSDWDMRLEPLRGHLGQLRGDLDGLSGKVEGVRKEMNRDADLGALKEVLMVYINQMVKDKVHEVVSLNLINIQKDTKGSTTNLANEDEVRRLIVGALKVYDADKTGLSDYALESAGGQVLSTRCTENYHTKSAQISVFGIPLWYPSNTPRTAIQPNVLPGNCWAFQGFPGFLVLQLNMDIFVSGFTMEHIPKSLSNGNIESAPKGFSVWGLNGENDQEPINFGVYEYSDADDAPSYQHFEVQNTQVDRKYRIVELRIESNHGNPNYTCLYRFRVHGSPI